MEHHRLQRLHQHRLEEEYSFLKYQLWYLSPLLRPLPLPIARGWVVDQAISIGPLINEWSMV
jgi:hypothetical protein